jgi:hypothetical protein
MNSISNHSDSIICELQYALNQFTREKTSDSWTRITNIVHKCISSSDLEKIPSQESLQKLLALANQISALSYFDQAKGREVSCFGIATLQTQIKRSSAMLTMQEFGVPIDQMKIVERCQIEMLFSRLPQKEQEEFCKHFARLIEGLATGSAYHVLKLFMNKNAKHISQTSALSSRFIRSFSSLATRQFFIQMIEKRLLEGFSPDEEFYLCDFRNWLIEYLDRSFSSLKEMQNWPVILASTRELQITETHPLFTAALDIQQFLALSDELREIALNIPKGLWGSFCFEAPPKDPDVILASIHKVPFRDRVRFTKSVVAIYRHFANAPFSYWTWYAVCMRLEEETPQAADCLEEIASFLQKMDSPSKKDGEKLFSILRKLENMLSLELIQSLLKIVTGLSLEKERQDLFCFLEEEIIALEDVVDLCAFSSAVITSTMGFEERKFYIFRIKHIMQQKDLEISSIVEEIRASIKEEIAALQGDLTRCFDFFSLIQKVWKYAPFLRGEGEERDLFFVEAKMEQLIRDYIEVWKTQLQGAFSAKMLEDFFYFLEVCKGYNLPFVPSMQTLLQSSITARLQEMLTSPERFSKLEILSIADRVIFHRELLELFEGDLLWALVFHLQQYARSRESKVWSFDKVREKQLLLREEKIDPIVMSRAYFQEHIGEESLIVQLSPLNEQKIRRHVHYDFSAIRLNPNALDNLFSKIENAMYCLPENEQKSLYRQIAYRTSSLYQNPDADPSFDELKEHFLQLKNGFLGVGTLVHALMHRENISQKGMQLCATRLYAIIERILEQQKSAKGAPFSPRTEMLLAISASIQGCFQAQKESIYLIYDLLKIEEKQVARDASARTLEFLFQVIQSKVRSVISSDNSLTRLIQDVLPKGSLATASSYLENIIGNDIGLHVPYAFDMSSCIITQKLSKLQKVDFLSRFFRELTPTDLIFHVKNAVNREGSLRRDIHTFLQEKLGHSLEGVWDVSDRLFFIPENGEKLFDFYNFLIRNKLSSANVNSVEGFFALLAFLQDQLPILQDGRFFAFLGGRVHLTIHSGKAYRQFLAKEGLSLDYERMWPHPENLEPLPLTNKGVNAFLYFYKEKLNFLKQKDFLSFLEGSSDIMLTDLGSRTLLKAAGYLQSL